MSYRFFKYVATRQTNYLGSLFSSALTQWLVSSDSFDPAGPRLAVKECWAVTSRHCQGRSRVVNETRQRFSVFVVYDRRVKKETGIGRPGGRVDCHRYNDYFNNEHLQCYLVHFNTRSRTNYNLQFSLTFSTRGNHIHHE